MELDHQTFAAVRPPVAEPQADDNTHPYSQYEVLRRNGSHTAFMPDKISVALTKAFLAAEGGQAAASRRVHEQVRQLTEQVMQSLFRRLPGGGVIHIEDIQDQVELALMRAGHHKVARLYVLYREERARERQARQPETEQAAPGLTLNTRQGPQRLDEDWLLQYLTPLVADLPAVRLDALVPACLKNCHDGMDETQLHEALILTARTLIERGPDFDRLTARLLLARARDEVHRTLGLEDRPGPLNYRELFPQAIRRGVEAELLDPELLQFDLARLAEALEPERDDAFTYLGLQTLYDRYFLHHEQQRIELPQSFFMRVAMGLAMHEIDREEKAVEFYRLLSSFRFMCSTPTLFNSATLRPQLSSCYLTTVPDDLAGIYDSIRDNALLSKFAGGLGNDWTRVRGLGAYIKGTNGQSQGVVPFLKVANDTAVAVNQGGKRKGAVCAYLESWHIDIEDFLELRKNTGDERRRTHDMNTANWIPDLFMERVAREEKWTLFSPNDVPDLHDLTGQAFRERYEEYERRARAGEISLWKEVDAVQLWRKMLTMLFETGHPWITFKDPCNLRYTNQHVGTVHSSNLCTEITLHTSDQEIAVCNLGSVNLAAHVTEQGLDTELLRDTVHTAMRMLDNVIDYNFYSVPQARRSNLRHRPVGLGLMGFQDALHAQGLAFFSDEALAFADRSMEQISYFAIEASADLAAERGRYPSYEGSLWSRGILPIDSLKLLEAERGGYLDVDRSSSLDWDSLREKVKRQGMRNSNTMAIAPTATISNICGVSQSIEPTYQNLYVKSNLSGEFTVVNPALVRALEAEGLWDEVMINDLKYFDGSVQAIDRVPEAIRARFLTAFEIDPRWLVELAARRQKWVDQAISLNLYMANPDGPALDRLYKLAWVRGLKTTYYLRTLGATHVEKTGVDEPVAATAPKVCAIDDPDCEACQ